MHPVDEGLWHPVSATRTILAAVRWVHPFNLITSEHHTLVGNESNQGPPASVQYRLRQMRVSDHPRDIELFKSYVCIRNHQRKRQLMQKVSPLVAHMLVCSGKDYFLRPIIYRVLPFLSEAALLLLELSLPSWR